jgi:hypothetical protein
LQASKGRLRLSPYRLTLCVSRETGLFLWPLKYGEEKFKNQRDDFSKAALRACKEAETTWGSLYWKNGTATYTWEPAEASADFGDPKWPDQSFEDLVLLAFENKILTSLDDPLIRRLLGKE